MPVPMTRESVMDTIGAGKVIPVVRTGSNSEALRIAEAVLSSGIRLLEITMTVPHAAGLISSLAADHPKALVGAGTVLDAAMAKECLDAGASFIVSPAFDEQVVRMCNDAEVAVISGGLTPTEIYRAHAAGADAVKVFPVNAVGGPKYLSYVKPVFPQIRIITTGGIGVGQAAEFLEAGAFAVGIGDRLTNGTDDEIRIACAKMIDQLRIPPAED